MGLFNSVIKLFLNIKFQGDESTINISIEIEIDFCHITFTHDINIHNSDKKIRGEYIIQSTGHYGFIIGVNLIGHFKKNKNVYGKKFYQIQFQILLKMLLKT